MSCSTTVRVVNATPSGMSLTEAAASRGRWRGQPADSDLPSGATATFATESAGRFGSTGGRVRYDGPTSSVTLSWANPFVGHNTYRLQVDGDLGAVCDGDDDASDAVVTFTVIPSGKVTVAGFLPSRNGFHFTNSWPSEPLKRISLRIADLPIGNASNGLCGGMAFAARDWFEARRPIPTDPTAPADPNDPLYRFIVDRLIASFDLPDGVVPYVTYMAEQYPADDRDPLAALGHLASRAGVLARRTWPAVQRTIDSGHPCPLGLVMVASNDLADLKHQHQVLAYGYQVEATKLTVWVYDPNSPLDDDITISYDTARTDQPIVVTHNVDSHGPLVCAFTPRYSPKAPPAGR